MEGYERDFVKARFEVIVADNEERKQRLVEGKKLEREERTLEAESEERRLETERQGGKWLEAEGEERRLQAEIEGRRLKVEKILNEKKLEKRSRKKIRLIETRGLWIKKVQAAKWFEKWNRRFYSGWFR